jgi:hypothetical protein
MLWALAGPGCTSTIPATNIADTSTQNSQGTVEGVENAVTVADIESGEVRPTLRVIPPWDIINHRVIRRGAKIVLSLVVFREDAIIDDDGFETRKMDQWRVLRLDKDGLYVIEVYRTRTGNKPDEVYYPTDAAGNRLTEIGFTFMGAFNNEPKPGPYADVRALRVERRALSQQRRLRRSCLSAWTAYRMVRRSNRTMG